MRRRRRCRLPAPSSRLPLKAAFPPCLGIVNRTLPFLHHTHLFAARASLRKPRRPPLLSLVGAQYHHLQRSSLSQSAPRCRPTCEVSDPNETWSHPAAHARTYAHRPVPPELEGERARNKKSSPSYDLISSRRPSLSAPALLDPASMRERPSITCTIVSLSHTHMPPVKNSRTVFL